MSNGTVDERRTCYQMTVMLPPWLCKLNTRGNFVDLEDDRKGCDRSVVQVAIELEVSWGHIKENL